MKFPVYNFAEAVSEIAAAVRELRGSIIGEGGPLPDKEDDEMPPYVDQDERVSHADCNINAGMMAMDRAFSIWKEVMEQNNMAVKYAAEGAGHSSPAAKFGMPGMFGMPFPPGGMAGGMSGTPGTGQTGPPAAGEIRAIPMSPELAELFAKLLGQHRGF